MNEISNKFTPEDASRRAGTALCLSGGGFRAAIFHLGALRRLNELGILSKLDTITSVSGGSLLAAHLVDRVRPWPSPGRVVDDWEERIAAPFRAFTASNLRTGPILSRFLPWNWLRPSATIEALAASCGRRLTSLTLPDLPERPRFVFCATDMVFGVNWIFEHERVGDYLAGYIRPAPAWPVARAVAASSCFPPIFSPMPVRAAPEDFVGGKVPAGPDRRKLLSGLALTDGGVYDNMGLEPVWKDHATVLASDGGGTFDFAASTTGISQLLRYTAIIGNQASSVRKRWLIVNFSEKSMNGTYWGIGSATERYGADAPRGYAKLLATEVIAKVRTDLDAFSEAESKVLENHGYLLTEAAIRRHVPELAQANAGDAQAPHPEWMDEARVKSALKDSHKRRFLGHW